MKRVELSGVRCSHHRRVARWLSAVSGPTTKSAAAENLRWLEADQAATWAIT